MKMPMIVIITPTIMDGTVVRWYRPVEVTGIDTAEPTFIAGEELVSASRNGVRVRGYLDQIGDQVLADARQAYEALRADSDADLSHLATHRRRAMFSDDLVPVGAVSQHG
jgi:hypothetical protein